MKNTLILVSAILVSGLAHAGSEHHWGYSGQEGPEQWGNLSPTNYACKTGNNQSPINLTNFVEANLEPIRFYYNIGSNEILNNGHTVQLNFKPDNQIQVNGLSFGLKQIHFHAPSENKINGRSFPLEAHMVHVDAQGKLAVIGVMFEEGHPARAIGAAWAHMPTKGGEKKQLPYHIPANDFLPSNRNYYRFNGSLTTPPCSEGVLWMVMKRPMRASKEQLAQFSTVMQHPNNRPIQPVNARAILR